MKLLAVSHGSHVVGLCVVIPAVVKDILGWLRWCDHATHQFPLSSDCIRIISTFDSSNGIFQIFRAIRGVWQLVSCEGFLWADHVVRGQIRLISIIGWL